MLVALALVRTGFSPVASLDRLAKEYGIEIAVQRTALRASRYDYDVIAHPVPTATLARYAPVFEAEWRRYPVFLMRRVGLRRIVIGDDVRVQGQPRAVVPEFREGCFWLDAGVAARNIEYGRRALHHDFFHMIDERDDPDGRIDPAWASLNPPGTRYGSGGWWMQTKGVGTLREDLPGFLTAYSTSAVEEDKAEVYSHLLLDPAFVEKRAAADPAIAAKVARIKVLLATFEPAMDAKWWAANGTKP